MCYCRGKGPLKNSSDVINAAKKIAEAGSRMDKLARAVADQVRITLFSPLLSSSIHLFEDVRSKPWVVFNIMSSYEVLNLLLDVHHLQILLTDTFLTVNQLYSL